MAFPIAVRALKLRLIHAILPGEIKHAHWRVMRDENIGVSRDQLPFLGPPVFIATPRLRTIVPARAPELHTIDDNTAVLEKVPSVPDRRRLSCLVVSSGALQQLLQGTPAVPVKP